MIGYHYTSKSNWLKIKKEGLKKYKINKVELKKYFPEGIEGIWCWAKSAKGNSHIGSILYQIATKEEINIVKLKIKFTENDILKKNKNKILLTHEGVIGSWYYHKNDKAYILIKDIKPEDIKLIKEYNINKLLK